MKCILLPALAFGTCLAMAGEKPVTQAEFRQTVAKIEPILRRNLGLPGQTVRGASSTKPATRAEVIGTLDRWFTLAWPKFRLTPDPISFPVKRVAKFDPKVRQQAVKLIQFGTVAPFGPLVTGKEKGLAPKELGDAIGFFLARIAELTHTPSTKFTPALMDN